MGIDKLTHIPLPILYDLLSTSRVVQKHDPCFWALFPVHQWDLGGGNSDYSKSQLEIFGGMYLPNAWTVYTDSKWFYDWENDRATIPLDVRQFTMDELRAFV